MNTLNSTERLSLPRVEIAMTNKCQMNCAYCANRDGKDKKDFVTPDLLKELFDRSEIDYLVLTGGEPTLDFDLLRTTIKLAVAAGILKISVNTNLELLDSEKLQELYSLGLSSLHFAMNTLNPEKYKKLRGIPSADIDRAMEAISAALDATLLKLIPEFVCMKSNLADFWRVYDYLAKLDGQYPGRINALELQKLIPIGRASDEDVPSVDEISTMLDGGRIGSFGVEAFCFGGKAATLIRHGIREKCFWASGNYVRINPDGRVTHSNFTGRPVAESISELTAEKVRDFFRTFICPLSPQ